MRNRIVTATILFIVGMLITASIGKAQEKQSKNQYYTDGKIVGQWHWDANAKCFSAYYTFKSSSNATQFSYHLVYYYPDKDKYVYFYNPRTERFWGRCPLNVSKNNPYQILNAQDQRKRLGEIDQKAFTPLTGNVIVAIFVLQGNEWGMQK